MADDVDQNETTFLGLPTEGREAIKRVLREAIPSRWKLVSLSLICMVGVAGFTGALAYSTKLIVNDVFVDEAATEAWKVAILVVFVATMKSVFQYGNSVISLKFSQSISAEYKSKIFEKYVDGDLSALSGKATPVHVSRLKLLSGSASGIVVSLTNNLSTDALTLVALMAVMLFQDPFMSLVGLILFPAILYMVSKLTQKIREYASDDVELEGGISAIAGETVEGIKTVKSYGLEEKSKSRFQEAVKKVERRKLKIGKVMALTLPLMETVGGLIIACFIIYASWQTQVNDKTPGEFTAFITAFLMAYQPAERVSKLWVSIQRSVLHLEKMYRLLDQPNDHYDEQSSELVGSSSSIEFRNVTFKYGAGDAALDDVSFSILPGERIAIVGRSGAGKTTLIDLIQNFCDPSSGTIEIGGIDIRNVANNEIRKNVALISQDVFLFDTSIAENIRDGNPAITDAELYDVAERAGIADFSGNLTETLQKEIGPQGSSLSGGQRQRVAIARAFAKKAKIYIFDEATSALDGENERAIMRTAVSNDKESTMLFVTHRPSTLKWVDRVMFLDAGRIIAFDTDARLRANSERYRSLLHLQKPQDALGDENAERLPRMEQYWSND